VWIFPAHVKTTSVQANVGLSAFEKNDVRCSCLRVMNPVKKDYNFMLYMCKKFRSK
jgi:hypothetical protein